jgi:magnesium transporter
MAAVVPGPHDRDEPATPGPPRVRIVACLGGISLERDVPAGEIHEYIREAGNLVWVDVQDPGPEELSLLLEEFGFHPLALEDVAKGQQRPKVDEYKGYLFAVTYGVVPGPTPRQLRTVEVDLFIGRNYVVTVHRGRVPALEEGLSRWTRGGALLREGVGFLVYTLMDALIDAYFPVIDAIEDAVEETEFAMFTQLRPEGVQELLRLKRTLVMLRRVLYPLRETFQVFLRHDHAYFSAGTMVYFQDVYNHILRILDVVDLERDMVTGALEAYLTVISNRLNRTMKALAFFTIAVAFISAVFGAWGMNFDEVPLAKEPLGFAMVAGGTFAVIVLMVLVGWVRGWI